MNKSASALDRPISIKIASTRATSSTWRLNSTSRSSSWLGVRVAGSWIVGTSGGAFCVCCTVMTSRFIWLTPGGKSIFGVAIAEYAQNKTIQKIRKLNGKTAGNVLEKRIKSCYASFCGIFPNCSWRRIGEFLLVLLLVPSWRRDTNRELSLEMFAQSQATVAYVRPGCKFNQQLYRLIAWLRGSGKNNSRTMHRLVDWLDSLSRFL